MNKTEAIEYIGEDISELRRNGYGADETTLMLAENGIRKCDSCKTWQESHCSGGNGEGDLCSQCFYKSTSRIAVAARKIYRELGDEIDEPPKKKRKPREPKEDWDGHADEDAFLNNEDMECSPAFIEYQSTTKGE